MLYIFPMNEKFERSCTRRKNADFWKFGPHLDKLMDRSANDTHEELHGSTTMDKQSEIRPDGSSQSETSTLDISSEILHRLPQSKSQHPLKRYSRTQSETINVGFYTAASSAKLKRVLSATEFRTPLAGCPKGLLIATEPPKSGESYRRRSNTDIRSVLLKDGQFESSNHEVRESVHQENTNLQQQNEILLLELEDVKRERQQLQKENERLQEELENRNKVIDHLIDFMKSSIPGEAQSQQIGDNERLTNNNLNRTHSLEKDTNLFMF